MRQIKEGVRSTKEKSEIDKQVEEFKKQLKQNNIYVRVDEASTIATDQTGKKSLCAQAQATNTS